MSQPVEVDGDVELEVGGGPLGPSESDDETECACYIRVVKRDEEEDGEY